MNKISKLIQFLILFLVGGSVYVMIELLWRGRSYPSMFVLGGICFYLIGLINEKYIITDELGGIEFRKPCPVSFILMKQYFECEFDRMTYIGDNLNKDFIAPEKLGMKTICFKNKEGIYYR